MRRSTACIRMISQFLGYCSSRYFTYIINIEDLFSSRLDVGSEAILKNDTDYTIDDCQYAQ